MSKGPGRIQRQIVAALDGHAGVLDTFGIAAAVYAVRRRKGVAWVTDAQLTSVRRALRGLQRTGTIYRIGRGKRLMWANERVGLWVTIGDMRQTSVALASDGDRAGLLAHAEAMLPLITHAHALGVNIDSKTPPSAA
jgi:hypothetical protein